MELDAVAGALYALPREEFTAARDAKAREARTGGDRALATAIGRLRRPTVAAWLVNQLARRRPEELAALAELGARLRAAHEQLDGTALRELSARRRELLTALGEATNELGAADGVPVSESVGRDLESLFTAALAEPAAQRALASGRLSSAKDLADADALDWPTVSPTARPRPALVPQPPASRAPGHTESGVSAHPDGPPTAETGPSPALAKARAELERTESASAQAQLRRDEATETYASAADEEAAAHQRVASQRAELIAAEQDEQRARQRARFARRQREDADRELADARRRATVARDRLSALEQ
jgi:hypothetical protein